MYFKSIKKIPSSYPHMIA